MANEAKKTVSAAIDSRRRLVRWFDDARKRRAAARRIGGGRRAIAETMPLSGGTSWAGKIAF